VDSTPLRVFKNSCIPRHKTFIDEAGRVHIGTDCIQYFDDMWFGMLNSITAEQLQPLDKNARSAQAHSERIVKKPL